MTEQQVAMTGITGHQTNTIGYFIATIALGNKLIKQKMYIIRDELPIDYGGILGVDFLQTHHAYSDYRKSQLIVAGKPLQLLPYQTYTLPARSEVVISVTVNVNNQGVIAATELQPGVFVGNSNFVKVINNTCVVSVINITEEAKKIVAPHLKLEEVPKEETDEACLLINTKLLESPLARNKKLENTLQTEYLNAEEKQEIKKICEDFSDIFYLEGDDLTYTNIMEHQTRINKDSAPVNVKPYRLPEKHNTWAEKSRA